ncbi:protein-arginine omega-N asymmetric methyltransferase [Aureococcus anophagefferens]|nr:protein-arginine omega-N asymmetric methyltransferase [Aureococcus anophagefferens]
MAALEAAALFDDAALGERLAIEEDVRRQKAVFVKDLDDAVYSSLKNDAVRMGAYLRAIARAAPGSACSTSARARRRCSPSPRRRPAPAVVSVATPGDFGREDRRLVRARAGRDLGRAGEFAAAGVGRRRLVRRRLPMVPPPATLLGDRRLLECIDANDLRLEQTREHAWTVAAPSTLTGFFCAPKIVLDGEDAIDCWTEATSWRSVLCLLDEPVLVEAGDVIGLAATADRRFPVVPPPSPPAVRVFATAGGEPSTPEAMLAAAEALRVEVAAFETERLSEAKAAAFAAFSVADSDGDGVLGKEDVASFLKVDEALAVKVMATFDVDEAGALTIDALLPRRTRATRARRDGQRALFAVTLKGALRDVLAAEREASRTASDEDASREAAKAEFASVASRTDAAARATAAAAFLLPLFDVANEYGGHLIAGALHGGNPAASAAAGVDAMALQLDPNANAALSALAALDLTAFNDGVAAVAGAATLYAFVSNALGVKADKIPLLSQSAQDYVDRRTPDFDIDNDGDGPQPSF